MTIPEEKVLACLPNGLREKALVRLKGRKSPGEHFFDVSLSTGLGDSRDFALHVDFHLLKGAFTLNSFQGGQRGQEQRETVDLSAFVNEFEDFYLDIRAEKSFYDIYLTGPSRNVHNTQFVHRIDPIQVRYLEGQGAIYSKIEVFNN